MKQINFKLEAINMANVIIEWIHILYPGQSMVVFNDLLYYENNSLRLGEEGNNLNSSNISKAEAILFLQFLYSNSLVKLLTGEINE